MVVSWEPYVCVCVCVRACVCVWGKRWRSWLGHCATNLKVAGSIPDSVIGIFHWYNPSFSCVCVCVSTHTHTHTHTKAKTRSSVQEWSPVSHLFKTWNKNSWKSSLHLLRVKYLHTPVTTICNCNYWIPLLNGSTSILPSARWKRDWRAEVITQCCHAVHCVCLPFRG
jgi:hypothetical protein